MENASDPAEASRLRSESRQLHRKTNCCCAEAKGGAQFSVVCYCLIISSGSVLGGMRSQVTASLSAKRKMPVRPENNSSLFSKRLVEGAKPAIAASQPALTMTL